MFFHRAKVWHKEGCRPIHITDNLTHFTEVGRKKRPKPSEKLAKAARKVANAARKL